MKALYFAWVRERVGCAEEKIEPPTEVATAGQLMGWLSARGKNYAYAFENPKVIRIALDKKLSPPETLLAQAAEIAFFPPMTGG